MKKTKEDLMAVWNQTLDACKDEEYEIGNSKIPLSNPGRSTHYYNPQKLGQPEKQYRTRFSVVNKDCLVAALDLIKEGDATKIAVLNMASKTTPGGGVTKGSFSQEEELFRRTNLSKSLYRYSEFGREVYGFRQPKESSIDDYPLSLYSGIYSPGIRVFRSQSDYEFLPADQTYNINVISVSAINRPDLSEDRRRIQGKYVPRVKEKIRVIFRIAALNGVNSLVLGAFGCGAYQNPANHVAELFYEVLEEKEFAKRFKNIVFAILEDNNSIREGNNEGNFKPFRSEFLGTYGLVYITKVPEEVWDKDVKTFVPNPNSNDYYYAYFSDQPWRVEGDDWDDSPWDCNAGEPSCRDYYDLERIRFKMNSSLVWELAPAVKDYDKKSFYSINDIKFGNIPWLTIYKEDEEVKIYYGTRLYDFIKYTEI